VPPAQVKVRVLNGAGTPGLAQRAAEQVKAKGFTVVEIGNADTTVASSQVKAGPGAEESAATLASQVPGAKSAAGGAQAGVVDLVLGSDWQGLGAGTAGASLPASASGVSANQDPCKAR
jgi:hypothetical protein